MTSSPTSDAPLQGFQDGECPECKKKKDIGNLFKVAFEWMPGSRPFQMCFCSNGHFWPHGCKNLTIKNLTQGESTGQVAAFESSAYIEDQFKIAPDNDGVSNTTNQTAEVKF